MAQICKNFRAILKADDMDTGDMLVARTRCKKWTCDYCAERNRRVWRARIINAVTEVGGHWQFLTVTAHENWRGETASLRNIRNNIDRLQKRIMRKVRKTDTGHYVRVLEKHKDNSVHVHYMLQGKITNKWLKDNARECGLGYQAKVIDMKHGGGAGAYITKYMTKDIGAFPAHVRRIVVSQGFPRLPEETEYDWRISAGVFIDDLATARKRGGKVYDLDTKRDVTSDDFMSHWVYPHELDD